MIPSPTQSVANPLKTWSILLASLFLAALNPAVADTVYRTGFESPTFAAGLPLAGQDGWIAPPPLSPNAAVITTDQPRIGRQTVRVMGANLVHQDFINGATGGYYDAIGSYRHAVNYDTGGSQIVVVSAEVRVDGAQTSLGNNFFSASISARATLANGDNAGVGELAISSDGHVYGYSGNEFVPVFQTSTRVTLGRWHSLAVVVDIGARKYSFFVDHKFQGAFDFDPNNVDENDDPVDYSNVFTRGSLVTYAAPDAGTLHKADYAASFDQFAIRSFRNWRRGHLDDRR